MWTRIVYPSVALAASLYAATLLAQGSDRASPADKCSGNLLAQVRWLRLEIVGGRLTARADRCSQSRLNVESPADAEFPQLLSLESKPHALIVRYESMRESDRLLFEVNERGLLTLWRTPQANSRLPEVCYSQPLAGKVTLTIGGAQPRTLAATDLWQLLIAERAMAEAHLLPLLTSLNAKWRWAEQLNEVEAALASQAGCDVLQQRQSWNAWIDDLDHSDFSTRQSADRSLRQVGQPVLAHLRQFAPQDLSGEQRRRVRDIVADLPDGSPDTASRVADWLAADKRVWVALLARGDLDQRIAAAQHLSHLCRRPLPFNPQGTAEQRTAQLAELTAKLADN
jgi:hypothetical protein